MSNRAITVRYPVFGNYEVRVIFARSVEHTGRRLGVDTSACAGALIVDGDSKRAHLVLEARPDAATIAHEASHAVRALFRFVGAKADDEAFAYHLDYLVGRIHKFLDGKA